MTVFWTSKWRLEDCKKYKAFLDDLTRQYHQSSAGGHLYPPRAPRGPGATLGGDGLITWNTTQGPRK